MGLLNVYRQRDHSTRCMSWDDIEIGMLIGVNCMKALEPFKSQSTAKIFQAKQALPPVASEKFFRFSIAIRINCVGKMVIWGHFRGIMELLLNNYLGYFLVIEKTFVFLFTESAIKPTLLLHANVHQCFYEPESPVTTLKSGQPASNSRFAPVLQVDAHPCLVRWICSSLSLLLLLLLLLLSSSSFLFNIWNRSKTIRYTKMDYLNLEKNK